MTENEIYLGFLAKRTGVKKKSIDSFWSKVPEFVDALREPALAGEEIYGEQVFYLMQRIYRLYQDRADAGIRTTGFRFKEARYGLRKSAQFLFGNPELWCHDFGM